MIQGSLKIFAPSPVRDAQQNICIAVACPSRVVGEAPAASYRKLRAAINRASAFGESWSAHLRELLRITFVKPALIVLPAPSSSQNWSRTAFDRASGVLHAL